VFLSLDARRCARWEFGHAAGFVLQLVALGALLRSVLLETSAETLPGRPA
jgi:hypothetical protein